MIRVRASVSLGELAESRKARAYRIREPKICNHCKSSWTPLSGKAEKDRDYCYTERCESASRNNRRRQRYLLLRIKT